MHTTETRATVSDLMPRALHELAELVAIPTVADFEQYPPEECRRGGEWVAAAFREAGIPDAHPVTTSDGSTAVFGYRPGPAGAPTVLLYAHLDVQPPLDQRRWETPPFELTQRADGRWYGRGAADCKGNIVAHLTALRALSARFGEDWPIGIRVVIEGSEEQSGQGLEDELRTHPEEFSADVMLIQDAGNLAAGQPTLTVALRGAADVVVTVDAFPGAVHSGQYGGAAPDAIAALIRLLDTLRDAEGATTVDGLDSTGSWDGGQLTESGLLEEVGADTARVLGGAPVADSLWARPAVTVLGMDVPPVVGSTASIQGRASARLNLRVPAGVSAETGARLLEAHLQRHAPWGVTVHTEVRGSGEGFRARTDAPAYALLSDALAEAFDRSTVTAGQGGSIPLCGELQRVFPEAVICLLGVEEPACRIHAPNESVSAEEIRKIATAEALFLSKLGSANA